MYNCSYCEHGECIASECVCDSGYIGVHCNESTCVETCEPQEACVSNDQNQKVCKSGCEDSPCVHGNCTEKRGGDFECTCEPGYDGRLCDNEIDECKLELCENNATCVDKVADFECICAPGYNGTYCGISMCAGVHCNNGTCVNGVFAITVTMGLFVRTMSTNA